ncbi:Belongs to the MHC class I family [Pristimantis euphronides]
MYGCELGDDGSIRGYDQYGYDGREFLALDTESWRYIATMPQAQITTDRWNSAGEQEGQRQRNYLQDICIEWLRKHMGNGREELERRVQPKVKVSGQDTGDSLLLHCQVYGFHPRAVHVKWMKNGVDDVPTYQSTHTLPNPDGTYQTRVTAEVIPKEGDSYSCYVDHSSLAERLNIVWEKPQSGWLIPVVIAAVVIAVLALCIAGFLLYKKNRNGYKTTNSEYSAYEMHCEIGNRN